MIAPYYESLAKSNPSIKFIKVDVDELEDVTAEAGVSAMPTFQVATLLSITEFNFEKIFIFLILRYIRMVLSKTN